MLPTALAPSATPDKTMKLVRLKTPPKNNICFQIEPASGLVNPGKNARKNNPTFGLKRLVKTPRRNATLTGAAPWIIYAHLAGGAGLFVYAAFTSLGEFKAFFQRDSTRRGVLYGGNALIQLVAVVIILGLCIYLSLRRPVHWDWTEGQVQSLSPATLEVLAQIPEDQPVEILANQRRAQSVDRNARVAQHRTDIFVLGQQPRARAVEVGQWNRQHGSNLPQQRLDRVGVLE